MDLRTKFLLKASREGDIENVRLCVAANGDENIINCEENGKSGRTPLYMAARNGYIQVGLCDLYIGFTMVSYQISFNPHLSLSLSHPLSRWYNFVLVMVLLWINQHRMAGHRSSEQPVKVS